MNCWMNYILDVDIGQDQYIIYRKYTDIQRPPPSMAWVLLDEREDLDRDDRQDAGGEVQDESADQGHQQVADDAQAREARLRALQPTSPFVVHLDNRRL